MKYIELTKYTEIQTTSVCPSTKTTKPYSFCFSWDFYNIGLLSGNFNPYNLRVLPATNLYDVTFNQREKCSSIQISILPQLMNVYYHKPLFPKATPQMKRIKKPTLLPSIAINKQSSSTRSGYDMNHSHCYHATISNSER